MSIPIPPKEGTVNESEEEVTVRMSFRVEARFDREVRMSREEFNRINQMIEADDTPELTDYVDWGDPSDVDYGFGANNIDVFELIETQPE